MMEALRLHRWSACTERTGYQAVVPAVIPQAM
jgi:hypothetical protein